ncbi:MULTISPECIES: DUF4279 domain-containing protein [Lysobacter]|uniref:DUF4279 domain-containing protein n=1 Tax=Lysobacter TaxID=68 RepID=UPI001F38B0E5|nr:MULTISPECIES: DUF4279 domain-containing protein [Lysobacter]UJB19412.1 DUF4279 domain-containing protein [Lysobacter capsici]UJQ26863.1 DUF4279 domain-containing protein [Lysobacter gummosus]
MHPYRYRVSLSLSHPDADLRELGEVLEVRPTRAVKAGDRRITPKGTLLPGAYRESSWGGDLSPETDDARTSDDEPLETFLEAQFDRLSQHSGRLRAFHDDGGRAMFFIGLFCDANTGLVLSPALMAKAAALGIGLGFDIYPPDPPGTGDTPA